MDIRSRDQLISPAWFALIAAVVVGAGFVSLNMVYGAANRVSETNECRRMLEQAGYTDEEIRSKCRHRKR